MASSRPEQRLFSWRMPTSHEIIHQQHWTFNSRKESQACLAHYLARHGESRVAKAALISAVPPLMVKTDANPNGLPKKVSPVGARRQPLEPLSRRGRRPLLWLQSSGRGAFGSGHRKLVAARHDEKRNGRTRTKGISG